MSGQKDLQASSLEKNIFKSNLVWIGLFRCPSDHPQFAKPGYFAWHNMMTFPRTAVELHILGKETIIGSPNIVAFYNQGQEYFRKELSAKGDWCEWFQFCPQTLLEIIQQYDPEVMEREGRPYRHSHTPITTRWLLLERQIIDHILTAPVPDELWVNEMILTLLDGVIADSYRLRNSLPNKKPSTQRQHRAIVIDAQRLLFEQLQESPTLATLAHPLHTSPFHLARIFREQTGSTIHHYLEQLRLRTALERLSAYKNDLTTLALSVGYKNHSHFSNAFRRTFGLPPSQMSYTSVNQQFFINR